MSAVRVAGFELRVSGKRCVRLEHRAERMEQSAQGKECNDAKAYGGSGGRIRCQMLCVTRVSKGLWPNACWSREAWDWKPDAKIG